MVFSKAGIALVTVVVFVILISIIAISAINMMSSQAILIEHQVRRIAASYAVEGALHKNFLRLLQGLPLENPITVDSFSVTTTQTIDTGPLTTDSLTATVNY
jgi:type II secretory pathway component PulK